MARPTRISTDHIVQIAHGLFLEHGYGVSTARIAERAGISEGSIYKRFPTKTALFMAAMGMPVCDFVDDWADRIGSGDVRDNLIEMASRLLVFFRELLPRLTMLHSQPAINPMDPLRDSPDPPPLRVLRAVTGYLAGEMELGRLRNSRPDVAARMLQGSLFSFVFFEMIAPPGVPAPDGARYVEELVDTLLRGVAP